MQKLKGIGTQLESFQLLWITCILLNPIPYGGGSWMFFWRTNHYYVNADRDIELQSKWQFTYKYIQSQKSFGFTFCYWNLSNFQISKNLIHIFFWLFQNFQEFVAKMSEVEKKIWH